MLFTDILVSWLQFVSMRQIPSLTRTEPMTSTLTLRTSQVSKLALNVLRVSCQCCSRMSKCWRTWRKADLPVRCSARLFEVLIAMNAHYILLLSAVQRSSRSRAALQRVHHLRMAFCITWQARREFVEVERADVGFKHGRSTGDRKS